MERTEQNETDDIDILRHDDELRDIEINNSVISDENDITTIINSSNVSQVSSRSVSYENPLRMAIINARSISAKIGSLVDTFTNLDLHFACVSETWLRSGSSLDTNIADLEESQSISLITKNRSTRGGGVAIAYDRTKMKLKKFNSKSKYEIVCASGKTNCNKRPIFIISYYVPPDTKSEIYERIALDIEDVIGEAKTTLQDPLIFVAGDANRRPTTAMYEDYTDIKTLACPASRQNAALLSCATNAEEWVKELFTSSELESVDQQKTDHKTICVFFDMPRQDSFVKTKIRFRPYTKRGEDNFGQLLVNTNWDQILGGTSSEMADKFADVMGVYTDICFPIKERTIKSSDLPWAKARFKRKARQRNRCFRNEGKTERWRKLNKEAAVILKEEREIFLTKFKDMTEGSRTSRPFFEAVKTLKHRKAPVKWDIRSMFPGEDSKEIAEKVAEYFNNISKEYQPIQAPSPESAREFPVPELYQISARLKSIKKPKGLLRGDIDGKLNYRYCDLIAIPLLMIFSSVARTAEWPRLWKSEQVTVIPKNSCPENMTELRNLSCTPLYSKLLESFVLEELKKTVKLSPAQYGGQKGCGVDHFLVETWDRILSHLEDNRAAVNITSIDFEKAFNRMDHSFCLEELEKMGATRGTLGMVAAFLHHRTMSVRIHGTSSNPRLVPGGSPQGSILGNWLFCVATNSLSEREPQIIEGPELSPVRQIIQRPIGYETTSSTPRSRHNISTSSPELSDESIRFFRTRRPMGLESSDDESYLMNQSGIDEILGVPDRWKNEQIDVSCYIDDFSCVEKVRAIGAITHISINPTKTLVHAPQSQSVFLDVRRRADLRKMIVNNKKTQMLCVTGSTNEVKTYMNTGDRNRIVSGNCLKILGFTFGPRPTVHAHLNTVLPKMRRRLWVLYHLRESGMNKNDLTAVYFSLIRSVADFACVAYHSLLTEKQSNALEKIQLRAFKTIYGSKVSYRAVLETFNIQTLKQRRTELFKNFTMKASKNNRFNAAWFPLNHDIDYDMRARKKYKEFKPKTERMKKNPLYAMRKILNEIEE